MCGIAGVITASASAAALNPQLEAAAAALRHRGPDDFGITLDGPVGLVHTRLSIIDLAGGHQPIVTPDRGLAAVVNGADYAVLANLQTGTFPQTIAINPATNAVYVTNKARG